jgi:hypothetical protein
VEVWLKVEEFPLALDVQQEEVIYGIGYATMGELFLKEGQKLISVKSVEKSFIVLPFLWEADVQQEDLITGLN